MKRGFSLLELVIVIAIIAILAALLQPVFSRAKHAAQIQSSASRLKQLHMAVELYRIDEGLQGYAVDQFPPRAHIYYYYLNLGKDFFESPCGYKEGIESNLKKLSYQYVPFEDAQIEQHFAKYQENALLFRDPHCNTLLEWNSYYMSKRKLGVLAGGRLVNEMAIGSTTSLEWWLPRAIQSQNP